MIEQHESFWTTYPLFMDREIPARTCAIDPPGSKSARQLQDRGEDLQHGSDYKRFLSPPQTLPDSFREYR